MSHHHYREYLIPVPPGDSTVCLHKYVMQLTLVVGDWSWFGISLLVCAINKYAVQYQCK